MKEKLVVIGNGMAGMRTVEELIRMDPDKYEITVFGAEPHGNYNRIMLTPVLFGAKSINEIMIHDFDWYRKNNITLHCGIDKVVIDIDRNKREVVAKDGTIAGYTRLLIATGSRPLMLPVPGKDVKGVMGFRDIADVEAMIKEAETKQHAVILGGGLLGLEAANGLKKRGMKVTVINRSGHLLNRQLDAKAAGFLKNEMEQSGLLFRLGTSIKRVISKNNHITHVVLNDDTTLPADILVMATGITPNKELAEKTGLHCEKGIIVGDYMQTSDPAIFSVGECVQHQGQLFGLVAPVYEQAKVCAGYLAHKKDTIFKTLSSATILKVTGIDLFSVGNFEGDAESEYITYIDPALNVYRKIVLKDNVITGMVMYGDTTDSAWYLNLVKNKSNIAGFRNQLIFGQPALEYSI